ncbi:hypothetical protein AAC387_Pa07g0075 [Persea americana]
MAVMIYPKEKAVRFSDFCPYIESKKKKKGSYKKRERKKTHNSNSVLVSSCPIRKRVSRSYSLESLHFSDLGLVSARKLQRNRSSQKS